MIWRGLLEILGFVSVVLCASTALAQSASDGSSDPDLYLSLGAKALYGTMASGDKSTVASRNLMDYDAEMILGVRYSGVIAGVGVEYGLWRQLTNPSAVSNTNTAGSQFDYALVLGYDFDWFSLLGEYFLNSTYTMSKSDASGDKVTLSSAHSPYAIQLLFPVMDSFRLGLEYTSVQYRRETAGGVATDLTSGSQVNSNAFGVVYVWTY